MKEEKKKNRNNIYSFNVKLDILLLNLIIIALELMGMKRAFKYSFRTLRFYTTDSNIMILIASIIMALCAIFCIITKRDIPKVILLIKYYAVCCITMTFVIVMAVLLPGKLSKGYGLHILYRGAQIYHHTLCPIISIITYVFFEKKMSFEFKWVKFAIIPTIIYGIVIVILNLKDVVYGPYPFLHIKEQSVAVSILWGLFLFAVANSINILMYRLKYPLKHHIKVESYIYKDIPIINKDKEIS